MRIWYGRKDDSYVSVNIDPFAKRDSEDVSECVSVSKSASLDSPATWDPAQINWSAVGAKCPSDAAKFGQALLKAAEIARSLDRGERPQFKPLRRRG